MFADDSLPQRGQRHEVASLPETRSDDDPSLHRVVIVGGGAAGLQLATRLGEQLGKCKAASITLVDRSRMHVWKPLLHEVAAGTLDSDVDAIAFIEHAVKHGYRYRIGALHGIDRKRKRIFVEPSFDDAGRQVTPRRMLGYDTLVIAVGSVCSLCIDGGTGRGAWGGA